MVARTQSWLKPSDYQACLKWNEKVIKMPPIPTLLEMYKPGMTPERVIARTAALIARMQDEINAGRTRRGECLDCGKHHGDSFACLSTD